MEILKYHEESQQWN